MSAITKQSRTLIVDDSPLTREMVRNALTRIGYTNLDEASNGRIALDIIYEAMQKKEDPFRLVFLDWSMPEMDGLTFLKTCRAEPEMNDLAIIVLTASAEQANMVKAFQNGATAFITKPFISENISKTMEQVLSWAEKHV